MTKNEEKTAYEQYKKDLGKPPFNLSEEIIKILFLSMDESNRREFLEKAKSKNEIQKCLNQTMNQNCIIYLDEAKDYRRK
jgi:hypothetical protein